MYNSDCVLFQNLTNLDWSRSI